MDTTRLIAIRHGETAWNVDTRLQGHLDIPLNERGLWQAAQAGRALADEPVAAIYSSDLARALVTAQAIAQTTGAPLRTTDRLRERSFGWMQGRTFADIEQSHPEEARRWRQRDPDFAAEGGESLRQLQARIADITETLAQAHPGELVVLVAHGGVMDILYRLATRQDLQAPRTWSLANAAINRLLWTGEGLGLVGWGDTSHLEDAEAVRDETST